MECIDVDVEINESLQSFPEVHRLTNMLHVLVVVCRSIRFAEDTYRTLLAQTLEDVGFPTLVSDGVDKSGLTAPGTHKHRRLHIHVFIEGATAETE